MANIYNDVVYYFQLPCGRYYRKHQYKSWDLKVKDLSVRDVSTRDLREATAYPKIPGNGQIPYLHYALEGGKWVKCNRHIEYTLE